MTHDLNFCWWVVKDRRSMLLLQQPTEKLRTAAGETMRIMMKKLLIFFGSVSLNIVFVVLPTLNIIIM